MIPVNNWNAYFQEVHDTMLNFSVKKLKNLHEATQERKDLVKEHVENAVCSAAKLGQYTTTYQNAENQLAYFRKYYSWNI